jgi:superfamily II DNA or RNA helicase
MITFSFNNVSCYIDHDDTPEDRTEIAKISHCLSYTPKSSRFARDPKQRYQSFSMLYEHPKFLVFPTGLISHVLSGKHKRQREDKTFEFYIIAVDKVVDKRVAPPVELQPLRLWNNKEKCPMELYDYQKEAVEEFLKKHRGIVRLSMGAGKTLVSIALTQMLNLKTLFLVNNKTLLRQTVEEFNLKAGIKAGSIGDSLWEPSEVTVSTIQTLNKRFEEKYVQDFLKSREFVIFDETQHASTSFQKISRALKNAYYRLGLSATVMMGEKEEKLKAQALTGPMIVDVEMKQLVDKKQLAKPTAIFIRIPRQSDDPPWNLMDYTEQYSTGMVHNDFRNMILAYAISEMRTRGYASLVLVERLDHGENIIELLKELQGEWKVEYVSGKDSANKRDEVKTDIQTGALDVLVTSRIFNEGVDLPLLESVVVASGYKAMGLTYQKYGRGSRKAKKKDNTTIFDCYDEFAPKLKEHSDARLAMVRKNRAFDVELIEWQDIPQVLDALFEKRKGA